MNKINRSYPWLKRLKLNSINLYMCQYIIIGRIYSVIRTQNKAEVSIWGVEIFFFIQVSFGPQKITVECKLWCQNSLWYVCSKSPLSHTHVLFAASCGIKWYVFYVLPLFVRSLHVAAFLLTYLSRTKSELAGYHRLMSRPDTCLGIRTHLSICEGMEHFILD